MTQKQSFGNWAKKRKTLKESTSFGQGFQSAEADGDAGVSVYLTNPDTGEQVQVEMRCDDIESLNRMLDANPVIKRMDQMDDQPVGDEFTSDMGDYDSYDTDRNQVYEGDDDKPGPHKREIPAAQRKASGDEDWRLTLADLDKEADSIMSDKRTLAKKTDDLLKEGADPEVLKWMTRFDKLGKK